MNQFFSQKRLLKRPRQAGQRTSGQLGGIGERCEFPQRILGGAPAANALWCIYSSQNTHFVTTDLQYFGGEGLKN